MSGELPAGWAACTLGDLVESIETGKSVKCEERPPQGSENGLVKISAVTWGEFDEEESKTLFDSSHLKQEEKIQLGDFLISRANTLELVGSCVLVKKLTKNLYLSDKVLRLVLPDEAKHWLLVCLRSQDGRKQMESLATGNQLSMRNISQQALREIRIPLPPLAEQTRIAAKLAELLAQVDTLKARIDGIPALLKRFRQSVLTATVSGRLTEEWRALSAGFAGEGNPTGWLPKALPELGELARGKSKHRPRNDERLFGGKYPFIQTGEVANSTGRINTAKVFYSEFGLAQSRLFPKGTLCITIAANIADTAILDMEACFPDSVVGFVADEEKCCAQFVKYLIDVNKQNLEAFAPATAQKNINLKVLSELVFPMPPLAEQTEIVRRVEQLFAFADQLEAKVNDAKARIDRLTQSILAKAFRGELVPQDPNDEPASRLLERIKAQRASAPKARRGRRKAEA